MKGLDRLRLVSLRAVLLEEVEVQMYLRMRISNTS
jgi:hypothetical protein